MACRNILNRLFKILNNRRIFNLFRYLQCQACFQHEASKLLVDMAIKRFTDPQELENMWQSLLQEQGSALFAFFGSEDPGTGESWCKDCVTADPLIRALCSELRPDLVLYECPVGERNEWKDQDQHPYRIHPQWRLERIPTLVLIEKGCEFGRLGEADCQDEDVLRAFLSSVDV